jgi:NAD(P)-dependent dehydrogenase (short-subunit alcohol dehydrogenase family)
MNSRRVLITGASKGIGHSVAERLAAAGHRPVGLARAAPATFPGEFHAVDLGDRTATGSAVREVLRGGAVDAVVNNVGLVRPAMIGSVDLDDLADVYDLNVRVAVQVTQAVLPAMIGRIVNVTSMVTVGRPDRTAYGAAKAALEFCSRAWAGELASTGITVNSVAPAICFLLSEDAGFITGQTLRVDGGGSIGAA